MSLNDNIIWSKGCLVLFRRARTPDQNYEYTVAESIGVDPSYEGVAVLSVNPATPQRLTVKELTKGHGLELAVLEKLDELQTVITKDIITHRLVGGT